MTRLSHWVLRAVLTYLVVVWLAVLAFDFLQIIQLRSLIWLRLFSEGYPTEWLQWFCIAGCLITAAYLWGRCGAMDVRHGAAYGFLAAGFAIMLIEDAGNIRHRMGAILLLNVLGLDSAGGLPKNLFELTFYSTLGMLMLWPFLRYGRRLPFNGRAAGLILAGYLAYLVAAGSSATRYVGQWYERTGSAIIDMAGVSGYPSWARMTAELQDRGREYPLDSLGFFLLDFAVEETLELIGAGCLLAGLLTLGAAELARERR